MGEVHFKEFVGMLTEERFSQMVKQYMDTVYRAALNYLRDPVAAEDVCQEVFIRLYRFGPDFESDEHCRRWLLRVAVNECRRALASPWRRVEPLENCEALPASADPAGENAFQVMMSLPRRYRVVLHLYYYEGYKTAEIAEMLRLRPSTVRSRLDRGREMLRQRLMEAENV